MRKLELLTAAAALVAVMGFGGAAWAVDDTADEVVDVTAGTNANVGSEDNAVDDDFGTFYALGDGGSITVQFTDNAAMDSTDEDLSIIDRCGNDDETIDVEVSSDGVSFTQVGFDENGLANKSGDECPVLIDFSSFSVDNVRYVRITDTEGGALNTGNGGFDLVEVVALHSRGLIDLEVVKTLTMGPDDAVDGDEDFGTIAINLEDPQAFEFTIKITNNADLESAEGGVVFDVIPAEFDLDPLTAAAEDADNQTPLSPGDLEDLIDGTDDDTCDDGTCDGDVGGGVLAVADLEDLINGDADGECADLICDGIINDDLCDDGATCDGIISDNDACMPSATTSGGGSKKGGDGLEPEFVTIEIGALDEGEMCIITVQVLTDENPASQKGNKSVDTFEPTSCEVFLDKNGSVILDNNEDPIKNTIALNDGVKVFDPFDGSRVSGPEGSIQLVCVDPES